MIISKVDESSAELIGQLHSSAWKQAYETIFMDDYISQDSSEKRRKECLDALMNKTGTYYLISSENAPIGIVKVSIKESEVIEIDSIYILNEYKNMGFGTAAIDYIKNEFPNMTIMLWVLEENHNAISFYKKNNFIFTKKKRQVFRGKEYTQLLFSYQNVSQ